MKTSKNGYEIIKKYEGLRLTAYKCPAGIWTIGYGHTGSVKPSDTITKARAEELLADDVAFAERAVNSVVTVDLTQGQFDALVSFAFNLGGAKLAKSTLLRKLNAGDYDGAHAEFPRWNRSGGQILTGLTLRREEEADLFGASP